jgi:hypothetical protein
MITQKLEKLDDKILIVGRAIGVSRSASSIYSPDHGVLHGELYYVGEGYHCWLAKT